LNPTILNGFIGTEIIRRLIGLTMPLKWIWKRRVGYCRLLEI
jgi:hypothetical protein